MDNDLADTGNVAIWAVRLLTDEKNGRWNVVILAADPPDGTCSIVIDVGDDEEWANSMLVKTRWIVEYLLRSVIYRYRRGLTVPKFPEPSDPIFSETDVSEVGGIEVFRKLMGMDTPEEQV